MRACLVIVLASGRRLSLNQARNSRGDRPNLVGADPSIFPLRVGQKVCFEIAKAWLRWVKECRD